MTFLLDVHVACQKLLELANVSRSYSKNNTGTVFLRHVRCSIVILIISVVKRILMLVVGVLLFQRYFSKTCDGVNTLLFSSFLQLSGSTDAGLQVFYSNTDRLQTSTKTEKFTQFAVTILNFVGSDRPRPYVSTKELSASHQ